MAQTKLNMLLQMRRVDFTNETNAAWKPAQGEPCFCTVNHTFKVGDGEHTWAELPFANQSEIEALIKVVDDKVKALNDTFATDDELEGVRAALDAAKLDKTTYNAYVEAHQGDYTNTQIDAKFNPYRTSADQDAIDATFALKTDVATEFAKYTTTEAQAVIDAAQDAKIKVIADDYVTDTTYQAHLTAQAGVDEAQDDRLEALETKTQNIVCDDSHRTEMVAHDNAEGNVSARVSVYATGAHGGDVTITAEDSVKVTAGIFKFNDVDVATANTVATAKQEAIDTVVGTSDDTKNSNTVHGAKAYAKELVDNIPAQIDYTVTCADEEFEATDSAPAFKRHTLTQNGSPVCTIDVPRDLVLKSGRVDKTTNELVLVLVNDEEIRVDVSHLIEYVTGATAADGVITVNVSDDFVATATINDGTITSAKFADEVDTYVDGRIDDKIDAYNTATVAPIAAKVEGWDATKTTVDANKATWDKAGTALQAADLKDYAKTADVVTNDEFIAFEATNSKAISDAEAAAKTYADGKFVTSIAENSQEGKINVTVNGATTEVEVISLSTLDKLDTASKDVAEALNGIDEIKENLGTQPTWDDDGTTKPLSFRNYIDQQDADILNQAEDYTDNATRFFRTDGNREKTLTISIPDDTDIGGKHIALVADTIKVNGEAVATEDFVTTEIGKIDTGVTKIVAGNDIVVTPAEGTGEVTVAHETFTTGEYTRDPATSDKIGDQYFFTGVTVDNGHVTGANVKSIASVLEAMTFILDGGTSIN